MSPKHRILVHVGLPKTGTTSLQYNVLMPLHKEGVINFVGRQGVVSDGDYHNPVGKILYGINDEILTEKKIDEMRIFLNNILSIEKLNVWSDESLILSHDCSHVIRWRNLRRILEHYDTRIFLTLRDPSTFIQTYYTELFRWHYQFDKELSTLEKFVDRVLEEPKRSEFDILFYSRLEPLFNGFRVTYVRFEDMSTKNILFTQTISNLLSIERELFERLLYSKKLNTRSSLNGVKYSQSTTLDQLYHRYVSNILVKFSMYRRLKNFSVFREFQKAILFWMSKLPVYSGKPHSKNSSYELLVKKIRQSDGYEDFIRKIDTRS